MFRLELDSLMGQRTETIPIYVSIGLQTKSFSKANVIPYSIPIRNTQPKKKTRTTTATTRRKESKKYTMPQRERERRVNHACAVTGRGRSKSFYIKRLNATECAHTGDATHINQANHLRASVDANNVDGLRARFQSATCRYVHKRAIHFCAACTSARGVVREFSGFFHFPCDSIGEATLAFQWNFPLILPFLFASDRRLQRCIKPRRVNTVSYSSMRVLIECIFEPRICERIDSYVKYELMMKLIVHIATTNKLA